MTYWTGSTTSTGTAGGSWGHPLPSDYTQALLVLDALSGDRSATSAMLRGDRWIGAEFAGAPPERIQFAQTNTGTMNDSGPSMGGPLGRGATMLRGGNALLSAAQVMQQIEQGVERAQVEAALARFQMDRRSVADLYAARAYVWGHNWAPRSWWSVPYSGPINERVAQAIMRHERDNPGTLGLMVRGHRGSVAALDAIVAAAVVGAPLAGPIVLERRRSDVAHPALSTDSDVTRAALRITGNQSWIAHHLIPFAVMESLLEPVQRAIAASGWTMDSAENLIALPRNFPTYSGFPNNARLPYHAGAHFQYSRIVRGRLQVLSTSFSDMPGRIRPTLLALEQSLRSELVTRRGWHAMLP